MIGGMQRWAYRAVAAVLWVSAAGIAAGAEPAGATNGGAVIGVFAVRGGVRHAVPWEVNAGTGEIRALTDAPAEALAFDTVNDARGAGLARGCLVFSLDAAQPDASLYLSSGLPAAGFVWRHKPTRWGAFTVEAVYAAGAGAGLVEVSVAGQAVRGEAPATGATNRFSVASLGRVRLTNEASFELRAVVSGSALPAFKLRAVVLRPAREGDSAPAGLGGVVQLAAGQATTHSLTMRYEPASIKNCLGYWVDPADWADWEFEAAAGVYDVEVWQGCGEGQGGSLAEVRVGGRAFEFRVEETGHFQCFLPRRLARVALPGGGRQTLAIRPLRKKAGAVMDVRQVRLIPVDSAVGAPAGAREFLDAGRVLFVGDSITYGGQWVEMVETYFRLAYPGTSVDFINLGLPSETVSGLSEPGHAGGAFPRPVLRERLDRALAAVKPGLVVACYGMNDGIYYPLDAGRLKRFCEGAEELQAKATAAGARVLWLTPPVFDAQPIAARVLPAGRAEYPEPFAGYDGVLTRYSAWLMEQRVRGWEALDVHSAMAAEIAVQRRRDGAFTFAADGVHPNAAGHWVMAREVLRHVGAPAAVLASASPQGFAALHPRAVEVLGAVERWQRLMKDAWLTRVGHLRPGMARGLPWEEALGEAARLRLEIQNAVILEPAGVGEWFRGFEGASTMVDGASATVVAPQIAAEGRPWILEAPGSSPGLHFEAALLGRGFHVVRLGAAPKSYPAVRRAMYEEWALAGAPALAASATDVSALEWAATAPGAVSCVVSSSGDINSDTRGRLSALHRPLIQAAAVGGDSGAVVSFVWQQTAAPEAQAWLARRGGGPVDRTLRPLIHKLGAIDLDLVEATPVVFDGRLWRFEWVRESYWANVRKTNYFRFVDPATGETTAPFADGCEFGSAFVEKGKIHVTGDRGRSRIEMFTSSDLRSWERSVVFDNPRYGVFNTSLCAADHARHVLMFEIDRPAEEAGAPFTARFLESRDLRRWKLTPPECNYAKDRYTAPHCLRWLDGWFYDFYLEAHDGYEVRVVRSRDLIHWQASPLNPVLRASPEDRLIANPKLNGAQRGRIANAVDLNNSDIDFCPWDGRLVVSYSWGNQQGVEHLAAAEYEGSQEQFLRGWFPESTSRDSGRPR